MVVTHVSTLDAVIMQQLRSDKYMRVEIWNGDRGGDGC
jgi:hypothetical protein